MSQVSDFHTSGKVWAEKYIATHMPFEELYRFWLNNPKKLSDRFLGAGCPKALLEEACAVAKAYFLSVIYHE
jgi:hypothetical protein